MKAQRIKISALILALLLFVAAVSVLSCTDGNGPDISDITEAGTAEKGTEAPDETAEITEKETETAEATEEQTKAPETETEVTVEETEESSPLMTEYLNVTDSSVDYSA